MVSEGVSLPRRAQLLVKPLYPGVVAARLRHLFAQEADCRAAGAGGGIGDEDDRREQGSMSGTWGHETTTR